MSVNSKETSKKLIVILGKEPINSAFELMGSIPISMAALKKEMRADDIKTGLKNKKSNAKLARENNVSEKTIERARNKRT